MTTTTEARGLAPVRGLLVAGGRSRRFGRDKRRELLGGRSLADIALSKLRAVAGGDVLIAGSSAFSHPVAAIFVSDLARGKGPISGIAGGLARSRGGVLVLPCDAPFVAVDTLRAIAGLGRARDRTVALRSARGWEPLVAFYPWSAFPALSAALREGQLAPHRLLGRLGALAVPAAFAAETWNVNRVADLERALALDGAPTTSSLR